MKNNNTLKNIYGLARQPVSGDTFGKSPLELSKGLFVLMNISIKRENKK